MNLGIIDLDGIVANSDLRFQQATTAQGKIDWKIAFNPSLVELDTLIEDVPVLLEQLEQNYQIIYLTSRPETMGQATEQWLNKYGLLSIRRSLILKPGSKQWLFGIYRVITAPSNLL